MEHVDGSLWSHHCDLGPWPGQVHIASQMLGAHHNVGATVGLARDNRDLGHRRLSIGKDHLGSMTDNTTMLLTHAWQKARCVSQRDQRNIETIAETDKARPFVAGINIQHAGQHLWLLGDDTHHVAP